MAEKITDNKLVVGIVLAVVAYMMVGPKQSAQNDANAVGNLPATNANVAANAQAIIDLREQLSETIRRVEEKADSGIKTEANLIRAEISRRETETVKYIDTLDSKSTERVNKIEGRLERDEDLLFNHTNSPPAEHHVPGH